MNKDNSRVKPKFNTGDIVVALNSVTDLLTKGKEYIVGNTTYNGQLLLVETDNGNTNEMYAWRFKPKEEKVVENQTETKKYYEQRTGVVYDLVFQGETLNILKGVLDSREVVVDIENLENTYHFIPYTKEMQKQDKKKQDLSTLETISETVKKNLDDGYVICHSKIEKENDLVTVSVVMGKVND